MPDNKFRVTLEEVMCIKPATGVNTDAIAFFKDFAQLGHMVTSVSGPLLSLAGPEGALAAAGMEASLNAIAAGSELARAIDHSRAPDQLYILMNGKRVWPGSGKYQEVRGGDRVHVGVVAQENDFFGVIATLGGMPSPTIISLMEYDSGSADDELGRVAFTPRRAGTVTFQVGSKAEDSAYLIQVRID